MKVVVYVEGPSDKMAMEVLLAQLLNRKRQQGIGINFIDVRHNDRKRELLLKIPHRALNILRNEPDSVVVILPDLYPPNKGFTHSTYQEMAEGMRACFLRAMREKGIDDDRLPERLKVFCFKHDLESLLLAVPERLRERLNADHLPLWPNPEDINHGHPPKRVLEDLFRSRGACYVDTIEAPAILAGSDIMTIAQRCPQCFKPFVDFLESCGAAA